MSIGADLRAKLPPATERELLRAVSELTRERDAAYAERDVARAEVSALGEARARDADWRDDMQRQIHKARDEATALRSEKQRTIGASDERVRAATEATAVAERRLGEFRAALDQANLTIARQAGYIDRVLEDDEAREGDKRRQTVVDGADLRQGPRVSGVVPPPDRAPMQASEAGDGRLRRGEFVTVPRYNAARDWRG